MGITQKCLSIEAVTRFYYPLSLMPNLFVVLLT